MDSHFINRNVDDMFSKKFCLTDVWTHEIKDDKIYISAPWEVKQLQELKVDLNNVKGKLNYYNLMRWHNHTRLTNRAGDVIKSLRKLKPELLTQAWCKFYEILGAFTLIPQLALNEGAFNSFHLCEAPGAFITSLNHFIKLNYIGLKWKWLASSLNPYYEGNEFICMISDDRFIVNTLENWCFGKDFTGNIKSKENLSDILLKAEMIKPIHLVTADGSVDCHTNPAEQESLVADLHYSETVIALSVLEKGGNFVLKIFTIFECQTVCLLYILRCSFNSVQLIKPVCSKEGNSEVYVVCLGFVGKESILPLLNVLISNYNRLTEPKVVFSEADIPTSFINKVIECSKFFKFIQVSAIERNIRLFEKKMNKKDKVILGRIRASVASRFLNKYNISLLSPDQFIVKSYNVHLFSLTYCSKDEDYSFADKVLTSATNQDTILRGLQTKLDDINIQWLSSDVHWLNEESNKDLYCDTISYLKTGKVFENINSSVFCMRTLIEIRNILENDILSKDNCQNNSFDNFQDFEWQSLVDMEHDGGHHTVDFSNFKNIWIRDYNFRQLTYLQKILSVLKVAKFEDTLILKNFPLLTQFEVGLIYILCKMFNKVGFVNPFNYGYTIIFYKLRNVNCSLYLSEVEKSVEASKGSDRIVINLVPVKELYSEEFYRCVTTVNHVVLKLSSLNIIKSFLSLC